MKYLEDKIEEMIDLYINYRFSYQKIADKYNCSKKHVIDLLKGKVVSRSNTDKGRLYFCNEDFFYCIDTEEKAYWLGFIFGDGYIYDKTYDRSGVLCITISEQDIDHLEKFKECIGSNHPVKTYKPSPSSYNTNYNFVRIKIHSNKIVSDLKKYGMMPNKSNVIGAPKNIDPQFYTSFVRGFFDADGSISIWDDHKSKQWNISLCKTKELLKFVSNILQYDWRWSQRHKDNDLCHTIALSKKTQTVQCLSDLYENAKIYLTRKYNKYIEIIDYNGGTHGL